MNNRIKSIIITVTAIVLAFGLLVACDGNVITNSDNGRAYTEVIATNGAFVYKGQSYDFLEDVLNVIKKAGAQEGAVKVSGNVSSRPVVIPEGLDISIDLNGNEISFFDVKDSAVKVSGGSDLYVSKGTLALRKPNKNLAVISSEGTDTEIHLSANVKIEGAVVASDGATLNAANYLKDVRMQGGNLIVEDNGIAVVTENTGTNTYAESPHGTIVDMTSSIEPGQIQNGYWYVERDGHKTFYGGLEEAVDSLEPSDVELVLIGNETVTPAASITLNQNIRLILRGYDTGTYNIILANGADLTITGAEGSAFTGSIISEGDKNSTLAATDVAFNSSVNVSGDVTLKNVSGIAKQPITSTNGNITIDNSAASANFGAGAITAKGDVVLTGYYHPAAVGAVKAASLTATSMTGIGDVDVTGDLISSGSTFAGTVLAATVTDGELGSRFMGDISATVDISLTGSTFNSGTATAPNVTSTNGDISMTNVSGTAGAITANGEDGSGNVTIDNSNASEALVTGDINAADDIDLTGNAGAMITVNGAATCNSLNAEYSNLKGSIVAPETVSVDHGLVGDNADEDYVYSPLISINDSDINVAALAGGHDGSDYTPADSVNITSPKSDSNVKALNTNGLSVTDSENNLTVDDTDLGGNGTDNTINGGIYKDFNYNGTEGGSLEVDGGNFTGFDNNGEDGSSCTLNGGVFNVTGSNSDPNFDEVNTLLGLVGENGNITVNFIPTDLISLSGNYEFGLGSGKNATLNFNSTTDDDEKLTAGLVVNSDSTASMTFPAGSSSSVTGGIFIKLGSTLNSNVGLIDEEVYSIYKLKADGKYTTSVKETSVSGGYQYTANIDVVFHSNYDPDSTVEKGLDYGSADLPTAESMSISREDYDFKGWSESQTAETATYEDGAQNLNFTTDKNLYAVWKESGLTVSFYTGSSLITGVDKTSETFTIGSTFGEKGLAIPTLANANHVFIGWHTLGSGGEPRFDNESVVPESINKDNVLHPWTVVARSAISGDLIVSKAPIYGVTPNQPPISSVSVASEVPAKMRYYVVSDSDDFTFGIYKEKVDSHGTHYAIIRENVSMYYPLTKSEMEAIGIPALQAMGQAHNTAYYYTNDNPVWSFEVATGSFVEGKKGDNYLCNPLSGSSWNPWDQDN